MKPLSWFILPAALCAAVAAHAKIERNVDKTFTVNGPGTILLNTSGGSITVQPGPDGAVKITARETIRADSDAEADELLKDLELTFDQNGNDVTATAKYNRTFSGFHWGGQPVQVAFIATVPAAYATDLRTSGGGITIGNLNGAVKAHTSGGGIKLGKLGGTVDAHTSGGSISLEEAHGSAKLNTSGGTISVGRVAGPADLHSSGGSIRIDSVEQEVRANTSGGSIHAGIKGPLQGDCSLGTSGGSIDVGVDRAAAFKLDAATSGGGVHADGLTITLEDGGQSRNKLVGSVNGGGPLLKLRTSGGHINVALR